jgi:bifunctional DNase/RNase
MNKANDESDMLETEIWTITRTDQGNAVILRPFGETLVIPIFIGALEIQSILIGFDHIRTERPLTHDLFLSAMTMAGFAMVKTEISALKDNIFYSRVYFRGADYPAEAPLVLDARPSDALALAVRTMAPIMTARKVLEQAGIMPGIITDLPEVELPVPDPRAPVKTAQGGTGKETFQGLKKELDRAITAEDYERAATIRDRLILLAKEKKTV